MPLNTGIVLLNRYRIVKLLGQGGFGNVYRAWDLNLKCACALKENLGVSTAAQEQFKREATILANLSHPNLVRVTDYFTLSGKGQYLVMEYIQGEDIQTRVEKGKPVPEKLALTWFGQILDALNYMHNQKPPVIHRDIKPANIRINAENRAMLVDFGIAKLYDPQHKTTVGARAVTPPYSPPEQYGKGTTDPRTDIYALGATLYAALTAQDPPESLSLAAGSALPMPRVINPAISQGCQDMILKAMALDPDRRYQKASEFKAALLGCTTPASPRQSSIPTKPDPAARRAIPVHLKIPPAPPPSSVSTVKTPAVWAAIPIPPKNTHGIQSPATIPPDPPIPPAGIRQPGQSSRSKPLLIGGIIAAAFLFCAIIGITLSIFLLPKTSVTSPIRFTSRPASTRTYAAISGGQTETPVITMKSPVPEMPTTTVSVARPTDTAIPIRTVTPESFATWQPCSGARSSRLHKGDKASVTYDPPLANRVRVNPGLSSKILGTIDPGEDVDILNDPQCADNMVWWYIRSQRSGLTGWTSEGDSASYWLVPKP